MAKILRGKHKGLEVEISQFCNDWFSVHDERIHNQDSIFSPSAFEFTAAEIEKISNDTNTGIMFQIYEWRENRLAKRRFV